MYSALALITQHVQTRQHSGMIALHANMKDSLGAKSESRYMDRLTKGRLLNMKRPGLQYECLSTFPLITK